MDKGIAEIQSWRLLPRKKSATVPGPVCEPITVPTLLITGAEDEVIIHDDVIQCLNDLGAVKKDLLFLGNAWHLTFFEKEAHSRQNTAVLAWLL